MNWSSPHSVPNREMKGRGGAPRAWLVGSSSLQASLSYPISSATVDWFAVAAERRRSTSATLHIRINCALPLYCYKVAAHSKLPELPTRKDRAARLLHSCTSVQDTAMRPMKSEETNIGTQLYYRGQQIQPYAGT